MSRKKPVFEVGKLYHIYNRGVEKREIFVEKRDYFRMVYDLFELNDADAVINTTQDFYLGIPKENGLRYIHAERKPRKVLVKIHAFCLMPNHYHLLLEEVQPGGIVKFMQKLGTAYTMYFNIKYERVGPLFQGRFKAVHVKQDAHFIHLPFYIHTNPLDLTLRNSKDGMEFLKKYRWSSFLDYVGISNFPAVTYRKFLLEFFGGEKKYEQATRQWLKDRRVNKAQIEGLVMDPKPKRRNSR